MDFYIKITKQNPDAVHNIPVRESIDVNRTSFNEEDLKANLDRVNMWIGNCDQKASFILTLLGVGLALLCTSDFARFVKHSLVLPVKNYWLKHEGGFDFYNAIVWCVLLYVAYHIVYALYNFLYSLRAKTDLTKFNQEGLQTDSMLHYQSISKKTYPDFCEQEVSLLNDLRSQFYVNSLICTDKFMYYKQGVLHTEKLIPALMILGILILFA